MIFQDKDTVNEINSKFDNYLTIVSNLLERKPIVRPIEIHLKEDQLFFKQKNTSFDIGVKRHYENKNLILVVDHEFLEILDFIILREVYYCFIPKNLRNHLLIKLCVILKVSDTLKKHSNFEVWERNLKSDPFYAEYYLRLNFMVDNIKQIFNFIHKYAFLGLSIEENTELFNDVIRDYIFQKSFLDSNEKVEIFKIFYNIFSKKRKFTNKMNYIENFEKLFKEGKIKYISTIKRLKELFDELIEEKVITPTYQINWRYFDCKIYKCFLSFSPLIDNYSINLILKNLTFCIVIDFVEHNLEIECELFIVIPNKYCEDLKKYFARLQNIGILQEYFILDFEIYENTLNLNYFQEEFTKQKLLYIKNKNWNKDLILSPYTQYIHRKGRKTSFIDLLLIDRLRWVTLFGFGVENEKDRFKKVKSDLFSYLLIQKTNIVELRDILLIFYENIELKQSFLKYLNSNKSFGFFYFKKQVNDFNEFLPFLKRIDSSNFTIRNESDLSKVTKDGISSDLGINIKYKHFKHKSIIIEALKTSKTFSNAEKDMIHFSRLMDAFEKLKIYNLNSIEKVLTDRGSAKRLYETKISRIKKIRKTFRQQRIKMKDIENRINIIIESDPPGAVPLMVNSITALTIAPNIYHIFLKDSNNMEEKLNQLKILFPRIDFIKGKDALSEKMYLWVRLFILDLDQRSKRDLIRSIFNIFQDEIISFKKIISIPFVKHFSIKNFYDLNKNDFFYSEDLFEELYKFSISLIKDKSIYKKRKLKSKIQHYPRLTDNTFEKDFSINKFIKRAKINKTINLSKVPLNKIAIVNKSLVKFLLGNDHYKEFEKISPFIKEIGFIPMYEKYGLEAYYLYLQPDDMNNNEWKMMFPLGFKKLEYRTVLSNSNSFLFNYIFPYNNPNFSYFNWLTKSKNAINKYIWFSVKEVIPILNFDYNVDFDKFFQSFHIFRKLTQKVLFSRDFNLSFEFRSFVLSDNNIGTYIGPKDNGLKNLIALKKIDIQKNNDMKQEKNLDLMKNLIKKGLVFPFLTLKNEVGFTNKFYAIIPNLSEIQIEKIITIFSFLNYGFIFRISGKYFLKELGEEVTFERGLFLKFYFPNSDLSQFKQIVCDLLDYFKIAHYFLSFDIIEGDRFRDELFPNWSHPNPMNCHIWNEKEGLWINHKSIVSNFEAIYPEDQKKYTESNKIINMYS